MIRSKNFKIQFQSICFCFMICNTIYVSRCNRFSVFLKIKCGQQLSEFIEYIIVEWNAKRCNNDCSAQEISSLKLVIFSIILSACCLCNHIRLNRARQCHSIAKKKCRNSNFLRFCSFGQFSCNHSNESVIGEY